MPKHVGVTLIMSHVLWFVFYCILLSEFVGQGTEYRTMHDKSNIKYKTILKNWTSYAVSQQFPLSENLAEKLVAFCGRPYVHFSVHNSRPSVPVPSQIHPFQVT